MYYSIIQTIILSIVLIFTVHYIFDYLKDTLTIYKSNNVLHKHNEKYQEILDIMKTHDSSSTSDKEPSMKDQLKNFLKTKNV